MEPFLMIIIYLIAGVIVSIGLLVHYNERRPRGIPEDLGDLSMLEILLLLLCIPEVLLYGLAKFKPFKSRNKVR